MIAALRTLTWIGLFAAGLCVVLLITLAVVVLT